jgi:hypothetical protein
MFLYKKFAYSLPKGVGELLSGIFTLPYYPFEKIDIGQ